MGESFKSTTRKQKRTEHDSLPGLRFCNLTHRRTSGMGRSNARKKEPAFITPQKDKDVTEKIPDSHLISSHLISTQKEHHQKDLISSCRTSSSSFDSDPSPDSPAPPAHAQRHCLPRLGARFRCVRKKATKGQWAR